MDLHINKKIALVCGASRGLGYHVAKELAREGATTIICSSNNQNIKRAAEQLLNETGIKVFPFKADLREIEQIDTLCDAIFSRFGKIDILVNNTGGPPAGFYEDFSIDDWHAAFKLTCSSAIYITQKFLPQMVKNKWGRIINLTSISVKQPIENLILSNSLRLAIVGWAKTVSNQYAKNNITVNNIATGYTLTERVRNLADTIANKQGISPEQAMANWIAKIPAARLAKPEEIAWMVAFLASEKAAYITGNTIGVDGGYIQSML